MGTGLLAGGVSGRSTTGTEISPKNEEFHPPRLRHLTDQSLVSDLADDPGGHYDTPNDRYVLRHWTPQSGRTVETKAVDGPELEEINPKQYPKPDSGAISLYHENDRDSWEFLCDLSLSDRNRATILDNRPSRESDRWTPSDRQSSLSLDVTLDRRLGTRIHFTVPYSLYLRDMFGGPNRRLAILPTAKTISFDSRIYQSLIEIIEQTVGLAVESHGSLSESYILADVIAEFVQSIPHETDWPSTGELNYVRTPAESLVDLTADCKDASLLLCHLYESFGFDPVFVFLRGDVLGDVFPSLLPTVSGDSEREKNEKGTDSKTEAQIEYPNHLAIALPRDQLDGYNEPIESESLLSYNDETYVYVESTSRQPVGTDWKYHQDKTPLTYRRRRELIT